ncbi:hypothetical protein OESDEN_13874 [Oesophagostomum dentatum]|uniref:RRM domain-containing protein n=1 Tax=Oesophagostomum dentatum TaxID=61180 RepID=A0A0B1ST33_OESDE|nr:hypothetical protein OESDEN_13874 [Oesophagostomum dentatum]
MKQKKHNKLVKEVSDIGNDSAIDVEAAAAPKKVDVSMPSPSNGEYVVGSLSSLFGGGSASTSSQNSGEVSISKGETLIKPKEAKIAKLQHSSNDEAASSEEPQEEEIRKDRIKQRENRKKAHEQRMTLEEKKRTLFVGNAPLSMDERECKKLFAQYGAIESVRMRSVMPTKETITKRVAHISHNFHEKQTSVNFYVKFKDEESVQKALA